MLRVPRSWILILLILVISGILISSDSDKFTAKTPSTKTAIALSSSQITVANSSMWVRNDGKSANSPTNRAGIIFPFETSNTVYQDGLVWGGQVSDGQSGTESLRVGGQTFRVGTQPGNIVSPGVAATGPDALYRVYRIRPDWQSIDSLDLIYEASLINEIDTSEVTQQQIQAVINQYQRDWEEWPVSLGAPYVDENNNGNWDPGVDTPGIRNADQTIWFVSNDLDTLRTRFMYGSPPVGLEVQTTIWAFFEPGSAISDAVFKRYRLIYKGATATTPGSARIDNMYLSQWSDSDIGNYIDDVVGCDTTLNMAFAYNGQPTDTEFANDPPAYGYQLLQGPIVVSPGDTADFNFGERIGFRNLDMTSFVYSAVGGAIPRPVLGSYDGTLQWYNQLQGFQALTTDSIPYVIGSGPRSGEATVLPLSGDPESGSGDVDGLGNNLPAGDRLMALNTGPFSMALNDTQEVIIAALGTQAGSYLTSVTELDATADFLRLAYESDFDILTAVSPADKPTTTFELAQNYPNPFNPSTTLSYRLKRSTPVTLTVYNLLGQQISVLVNKTQQAGNYSVEWNGRSSAGQAVASGIYLYSLKTREGIKTRKMMLLK